MDLGLDGQVALVVGASRGVGRATAEVLAQNGAKVAAAARSSGEIPGTETFVCDVSTEDGVRKLYADVKAKLGPPAICIWSVSALFRYGKLHNAEFPDVAADLFREVALPALLCKLAIPDMMRKKHGRIVFVGSAASVIGSKGAPTYCMSKAALESLSRSLAIDYSRYGITTNVARLGFTDTERMRERIAKEPERAERYAAAVATHRLVTPSEAANGIAFLCSQQAGSITGTALAITGGLELAGNW